MAEIIASGDGWTLDGDGLLSIFIQRDMPDYDFDAQPWKDEKNNIISAVIDSQTTSIGDCAFYECTALTSVTIPDSVTSIGEYAFSSCDSLTSATIGDGVTTIGYYAFYCCYALTGVTIGDSVTGIESGAFENCDSLTSVTIPDSVTSIGVSAFRDCASLTSVTIPDSVTGIGYYAFYNCNRLTDVYYAGTETQWGAINIGSGNQKLTNATIHYAPETPTLESIAVTTPPTKTEYIVGETFDPAGMVVTATYSDGTTAVVAGYATSPTAALTRSDASVTISYTEGGVTVAATTAITVTATATLASVRVTTPPTKTAYAEGETFDPAGMVVTATYADGSAENVTNYETYPAAKLTVYDASVMVSYAEGGVTATDSIIITVAGQFPSYHGEWPRSHQSVMLEIAERIGAPLDPRTRSAIGGDLLDEAMLGMSMREVMQYVAALNAGNWTVTDAGTLYLVPLAASDEQDAPELSAHNAESLSAMDPLEAWSGVRGLWDGDDWNAQDPDLGDDTLIVVKRGEQIGSAGDTSGRVLTVKVVFGEVATPNPAHSWDRGAQRMLEQINGSAYAPFEARNAMIDPAAEIGDAVSLPDGTRSMICAMSGELDGLCAVDISAPPDGAGNSAYSANWL